MADMYYYMWEMVTSLTIIILVAAYIIHDRIRLRLEKIEDEKRRTQKLEQLSQMTRSILGGLAVVGGGAWMLFIKTHTIYISEELMGFHTYVPPIIMAVIGIVVLSLAAKRYLRTD
ncbi:MAG: hypothetical protein ACQERN_06640 [Thermodesulfobacteriota bacterium]